ncbi:MAG: hypothetical protein ACRC6G_10285, partial [Deefgea sp.]
MAFDSITTKVNLVAGDTTAIDAVKRNQIALMELTGSVGKLDAKYVSLGATQRSSFDLSKRLAQAALNDVKAQLNAIEAYDAAYKELITDIRAAGQAEDSNRQKASTAPASSSGIRGEQIGKVGQLAGLAGIAGGAQAGQAVSVLIEGQRALGLIGDVARDAFSELKALPIVTSELGVAALGALPALAGTVATVGAIAIAGGALAAIGIAVYAAGQQFKQAGDDARDATEAYIAERNARREVRDEQLTTIQLQARLANAERSRADAQADIDKAAAVRAAVFQDLVAREKFDPGDLNAKAGFAAAEASGIFAALDADAKKATDSLALADGEIEAFTAALNDGTAAINDAAAAEKELNDSRAQGEQRLKALVQQENDLISAFEAAAKQREADLARQAAREGEGNATKLARANEDLNATLEAQAAAHADKMIGISDAGQDAIATAQQSILDKQVSSAQAIADAQAMVTTESADAAAKYARDELRRLEQFNLDKLQSERKFRLSQNQAVLDNDVDALLRGRQNRNIELKEAQENFDATSKERDADYAVERAAREQAASERIAAINNELATFTAATQQKILQETVNIEERKRLEQAAFDETQARDAAARALRATRDAEDAATRLRYQEEDRALAEARAQTALDAQLLR